MMLTFMVQQFLKDAEYKFFLRDLAELIDTECFKTVLKTNFVDP